MLNNSNNKLLINRQPKLNPKKRHQQTSGFTRKLADQLNTSMKDIDSNKASSNKYKNLDDAILVLVRQIFKLLVNNLSYLDKYLMEHQLTDVDCSELHHVKVVLINHNDGQSTIQFKTKKNAAILRGLHKAFKGSQLYVKGVTHEYLIQVLSLIKCEIHYQFIISTQFVND